MNFIDTKLRGVKIVEPVAYGDNRGWFMETYNEGEFHKNNLYYNFVQDNQSFSAQKGVLRGLHFQNNPFAQAKLVRCTQGAILDVAVDIRKGSDTYLQYVSVELSAENKRQLLIPRGFAHGFVTLTDNVMVQYKVDNLYSKPHDRGIQYCDPSIGVKWDITNPILSVKDTTSPMLKDSDANFTIKVLVTGVKGQLGYDMVKKLTQEGFECKGIDIDDCDITDENAVKEYIVKYNPDVVVHCAAYTAVDRAEENEAACRKVNVEGSENIAKACRLIDAKMVYVSTDYVYGGAGENPFEVTDKIAPLNVYGKTKFEGEQACRRHLEKLFVVRTSWVFGKNGGNFVKTMLKLAGEKKELSVVSDQIGSPTYTVDLADFLFYIIQTDKYGTYHCSNEGYCSWNEFAKEIFRLAGKDVRVNEVLTKDYKSVAARPLNSRLSKKCLEECGFGKMPTWQDALDRYLKEIGK